MTLLTPEQKIDEIVGTFIALKYDDTTDEYSDGTLERWNNMKQAILSLLGEEKINVINKILNKSRYTFNPVGGISNIQYICVSDIEKELQELKQKEN